MARPKRRKKSRINPVHLLAAGGLLASAAWLWASTRPPRASS